MAQQLDQINIFTTLGVRFWDAATEMQVRTGLAVTAHRRDHNGRRVAAFRTRSGIYAFQGLPGLQDLEYTTVGPDEQAAPTHDFVVNVEDSAQRFIPTAFSVTLPLAERGVYPLLSPGNPPETAPPGFYLFSASTRRAAPGQAMLRGDLVDAVGGGPAAHAVVEVSRTSNPPSPPWYGIADAYGKLAVLFPYPTLNENGIPPNGLTSLPNTTWELTVRVRYAPTKLIVPPGVGVPEITSIFSQDQGGVYTRAPDASPPGTLQAQTTATLRYGAETMLRTEGRSTLLIQPAP